MTSRKRKLRRRNDIPMNPEPLPGTTDRRVARLLRLLAKNATIVISGTRIAREIGVSRSAGGEWGGGARGTGGGGEGQGGDRLLPRKGSENFYRGGTRGRTKGRPLLESN